MLRRIASATGNRPNGSAGMSHPPPPRRPHPAADLQIGRVGGSWLPGSPRGLVPRRCRRIRRSGAWARPREGRGDADLAPSTERRADCLTHGCGGGRGPPPPPPPPPPRGEQSFSSNTQIPPHYHPPRGGAAGGGGRPPGGGR